MSACVALFRGINVGGRHILPMQALRAILERCACHDVSTYIQSGNAVFRSARERIELAADVVAAIDAQFGFAPRVLLLPARQFIDIADRNPFPDAEGSPKQLHLWFLAAEPDAPDLERMQSLAISTERFELGEGALYLHAPGGIGRSKLAAKIADCLGVETTARNWNTVARLREMVTALDAKH